jgi:hypothetical protein
MISLEQSVKDQFAKVFESCDWQLFKEVADINLAEAARLKMSSLKNVPLNRRLLIRNTRKRLLIGIGIELLLKAIYLKSGYGINKPLKAVTGPTPPFKLADADQGLLNPNDTLTLSKLIENLTKVVQLSKRDLVIDGLRIAKVFRNKEGHVVTHTHIFNPSNYRAIEASLVEIYSCAFGETLKVQFSLEVGEKGIWDVQPDTNAGHRKSSI